MRERIIKALLDPACLRTKLVNWRESAALLTSLIEHEVSRRLNDPEKPHVKRIACSRNDLDLIEVVAPEIA